MLRVFPLVVLVCAICGCYSHSESRILAKVVSPSGEPIPGATVGAVCPGNYGAGAVTDGSGSAELVLFFYEGEPCTLMATKLGHGATVSTDITACEAKECEELVLELEPAQ